MPACCASQGDSARTVNVMSAPIQVSQGIFLHFNLPNGAWSSFAFLHYTINLEVTAKHIHTTENCSLMHFVPLVLWVRFIQTNQAWTDNVLGKLGHFIQECQKTGKPLK